MAASRKILEAEKILTNLEKTADAEFDKELKNFVRTINDVFLHLLDEYNVKFDLKIQRVGLEKFKTTAKKLGKIEAINFLIWYDREYRKIRNNPTFEQLLEKEQIIPHNNSNIIKSCIELLDATKKMSYYAYENF